MVGDKAPVYDLNLEDLGRFNDTPALPFNAYGTLAWARSEFDNNSASSQVGGGAARDGPAMVSTAGLKGCYAGVRAPGSPRDAAHGSAQQAEVWRKPQSAHPPPPTPPPKVFFLLKESELTPTGANLLDGRYAVFGYVTQGQDSLGLMKVRVGRRAGGGGGCTLRAGAHGRGRLSSRVLTRVDKPTTRRTTHTIRGMAQRPRRLVTRSTSSRWCPARRTLCRARPAPAAAAAGTAAAPRQIAEQAGAEAPRACLGAIWRREQLSPCCMELLLPAAAFLGGRCRPDATLALMIAQGLHCEHPSKCRPQFWRCLIM